MMRPKEEKEGGRWRNDEMKKEKKSKRKERRDTRRKTIEDK